ncbi:hypothetical protein [Ramlibacter henchirensis]|uniref:hypothetical protein n=1 Tax=Ramlibacter henchirensis TaxID=204072 RepID=UPI001431FE4D|nr:hypothetical protein [Ramlibacter henchirensis]
MLFRTNERSAIPVRRYGRVPPRPGEAPKEERNLPAMIFLLTCTASVAGFLYAVW